MFALNNTIKIKTTTFARIFHNVQKLTANTRYQIQPTTKRIQQQEQQQQQQQEKQHKEANKTNQP